MGKNRARYNEKNRKFLAKTDTVVVSSRVRYNADTTCFTVGFLYDMCDTSMGGDIQVVYV